MLFAGGLPSTARRCRCYCVFLSRRLDWCDACFAGEKLQDTDVDAILKFTGTEEDLDGNIKYEGKIALH